MKQSFQSSIIIYGAAKLPIFWFFVYCKFSVHLNIAYCVSVRNYMENAIRNTKYAMPFKWTKSTVRLISRSPMRFFSSTLKVGNYQMTG